MKNITIYECVTGFIGELNDTSLSLKEKMACKLLRVHRIWNDMFERNTVLHCGCPRRKLVPGSSLNLASAQSSCYPRKRKRWIRASFYNLESRRRPAPSRQGHPPTRLNSLSTHNYEQILCVSFILYYSYNFEFRTGCQR
jgi:hypothetical protein